MTIENQRRIVERIADMSTHFLDYKNRIIDLRTAEKEAREEKEKARLNGDKDAEERWRRAEETVRTQAERLENVVKSK